MTLEEIKAAQTAEAEAKAKKEQADADFEAEIADLSDEEKEAKRAEREASNTDNQTDYKAIAQAERERREKAEKALAEKRFLNSKRNKKEEDEEELEDDDEDKPVTTKELQRILEENTNRTTKALMGTQIKEIVKNLADSPEEAEAIIEIHANRTFPSYLTLEEQLEESHAIVNRKRILSKTSELTRALKSKNTALNDVAGTHRDAPQARAKIAPDLEASLKSQGFVLDQTSKVWKKKLPNGKILCKDTRVKPIKTFTI